MQNALKFDANAYYGFSFGHKRNYLSFRVQFDLTDNALSYGWLVASVKPTIETMSGFILFRSQFSPNARLSLLT